MISVGDRVSLTDTRMTHIGTVTTRREDGVCTVKWDSGMTERLHESELGRPDTAAYPPDDPKSGGYPDRVADIWDSREK